MLYVSILVTSAAATAATAAIVSLQSSVMLCVYNSSGPLRKRHNSYPLWIAAAAAAAA